MPIQIVDDFGAWDDLGIVQPVFEDWLTFPDFSYSLSGLIRLRYIFNEFDQNTYGYIRCIYEVSTQPLVGRWVRFYPKSQGEILNYPHPEDFGELKINPKRIYQVMKRHRRRRSIGTLQASLWSVNLLVCNENLSDNPNDNQPQIILPPSINLGLI